MIWLWILAGLVLATFGLVVFRGAPYVPTLRRDIKKAIDLAGVKKGECIVDLGSGDGRLLIAAAEQGIESVGYELNPLLVLISKFRTRKYKDMVNIKTADFWRVKLPADTGAVFIFLAEPYMYKLNKYLQAEAIRLDKPVTLISYAFELPGHKPVKRDGGLIKYIVKP